MQRKVFALVATGALALSLSARAQSSDRAKRFCELASNIARIDGELGKLPRDQQRAFADGRLMFVQGMIKSLESEGVFGNLRGKFPKTDALLNGPGAEINRFEFADLIIETCAIHPGFTPPQALNLALILAEKDSAQ